MNDAEPKPPVVENDVIVCKVDGWYYRHMAKAGAFLLVLGLYFFYDGFFGYANDNKKGEAKQWFDTTYLESYDMAKRSGTLEAWMKTNSAAGLPVGENGEPPKWATYAAQKGWPEEVPKHHGEADFVQQYEWGSAMIFGVMALGVVVLLNRNKKFIGHPDHMIMPNGRELRYAEAFKVDKRKWDQKGLAYVYYRRGDKQGRVTIDDLKFNGAGLVLARLLKNFSGELIEKAPEEEEPDPAGTPPPAAPTPDA